MISLDYPLSVSILLVRASFDISHFAKEFHYTNIKDLKTTGLELLMHQLRASSKTLREVSFLIISRNDPEDCFTPTTLNLTQQLLDINSFPALKSFEMELSNYLALRAGGEKSVKITSTEEEKTSFGNPDEDLLILQTVEHSSLEVDLQSLKRETLIILWN